MRNRLVLTAGLLLLGSGAARAQLGFRAGGSFANLSTISFNDDYREASSVGRVGFVLGAFWEQPLRGRWTLVPELHYSYQRQQLHVLDNSVNDGSYQGRYRLTLGYVNLPVLARATFGKWYLELGPQLGVLAHAHEQGEEILGGWGGAQRVAVDRAAASRYQRADLALSVGGGLRLPSGWGVSLRTSSGFVSVTEENPSARNYGGSLRNYTAQLALTYQLKPRATAAAR
jgi:hypothetical protein